MLYDSFASWTIHCNNMFYSIYSIDTFLYLLWDALDRNNFYFLFSFIFWLYKNFVFFFFFFSFGWWRGMWHCSHMTCHMMWCHRPRRWWKDLEDDIRAHIYNMVALRQIWNRGIDIRVGLSIGSTDQACFVYIGL